MHNVLLVAWAGWTFVYFAFAIYMFVTAPIVKSIFWRNLIFGYIAIPIGFVGYVMLVVAFAALGWYDDIKILTKQLV